MRKILIAISILLVATMMFQIKAFADDIITLSIDQKDGIVTIKYNEVISKSMKVVIEKDANKYTYNMIKNVERLPLQLGNGYYSIKVFEAIEGTSYSKVYETSFDLKIENEERIFLTSNQIIDWNNEDKVVTVAKDLTKNLTTEKEKVTAIYKYVVKNFKYDYQKIESLSTEYIPDINKLEVEKKGICYDYSVLLASMLRSQGIECKVVKGYSEVTGTTYHAWNEIYLQNEQRWLIVDTTADSIYSQSGIKYTMEKDSDDYSKVKEF